MMFSQSLIFAVPDGITALTNLAYTGGFAGLGIPAISAIPPEAGPWLSSDGGGNRSSHSADR
jgi:hypothetical protein